MRALLASLALLAIPAAAAAAETTQIDTSVLPSREIYETAKLTPLALTPEGSPSVVLLDLEAGVVVPPHATESGLRLLTVISGDMSWGDGDAVEETKETVYAPGSILTLPAGVSHWVAARSGPVRLQLIVLDDETAAPGVEKQMR